MLALVFSFFLTFALLPYENRGLLKKKHRKKNKIENMRQRKKKKIIKGKDFFLSMTFVR